MRRLPRHAALLIIFLCGAAQCLAQSGGPPPAALEYNKGAWKEFSSPEGGFTVSVPGAPTLKTEEAGTGAQKIPHAIYTLSTGTAAYIVSYTDLPAVPDDPAAIRQILDAARDEALGAGSGHRLLAEKEIVLDGHAGREWLMIVSGQVFKARIFYVKNRLYQLMLGAPPNAVFSNGQPSADPRDRTDFYEMLSSRFFDSFKLTATRGALGEVDHEAGQLEGKPAQVVESWKEFSPEGGRFKVLLPGTPTPNVQSFDSPYGKLERHEFGLRTFAFYAISYIDFPEHDGLKNVKAFFDGVRTGTLASTKAELLEEREDNRFGRPGRFIKARLASGHVSRIRLHLIGNRFYTLFVVTPEQGAGADALKVYEETATKFLDSFKPADAGGHVKGAVLRAPLGVNVDPAVARSLPFSRKGEPEPEARVSGGILNGKARKLPAPAYPQQAKEARAAGKVEVRVVVDESGKVIWASAAGGHASLLDAAEAAAYRAEFEPMTHQGKPVKVKGVLLYNFIAGTH